MENNTNGFDHSQYSSKTNFPDMEEQNANGAKYSYKKYGFIQARYHGANPTSLGIELHKIYESFKNKVRNDEDEQEKLKHPIRIKLENIKIEKDRLEEKIKTAKLEKIPGHEKQIQSIKDEIASIRRNPGVYQGDKPNKIAFIIGMVVLTVLTIYLWIFYTSAGYSAFFRNFVADDINVANSIFDAKAIVNAWNDGAPAFVLVISMPFIFLGLGYLIHKYLRMIGWRRYVPLTLLIITTFAFDYIIGYEIVKKVYDLKATGSMSEMAEYSIAAAFSDINFWLIIFAGFVTYLIWGFLFDKLMEDYEKFDVVKVQVALRENELLQLKEEIKAQEEKIETLVAELANTEKDIKACEQDLSATFINPKEFEHIVFQFSSGWMQFIEGGLLASEERKNTLRMETDQVIKTFISTINNENKIYETAA